MIYLGGPYTSSSTQEHWLNIGRLYVYKIWLNLMKPGSSVICWPLETCGFDYGDRLRRFDWLQKALHIASRCDEGYFVPGAQNSPGSVKEMELFRILERPYRILIPLAEIELTQVKAELAHMEEAGTSFYSGPARYYLNSQEVLSHVK